MDDNKSILVSSDAIRNDGVYKISTGVSNVEISLRGGRVLSITLDKYKKDSAHDLNLYKMMNNAGSSEFPAGLVLGKEQWRRRL